MSAFHKPDVMSSQQQLQSSLQEIQELKELCCYLHDERAKLINLISEWKKFGKHIFGTMQMQKETFKKEITDLEFQERHLLSELRHLKEIIANKGSGGSVTNVEFENLRKGGDGSSSPSPTNIFSNKNETKRNDIYMNPRDAISSPSSLDSYKQSSKYVPSYEHTGHNMSSEYATLNTINAYDIKKFHHSMPRQRLPSNSTMRSSYGSDNVPLGHRGGGDNLPPNQLYYTNHFNDIQYQQNIKYQLKDPKYQPSYNEPKYQQQLTVNAKCQSNPLSEEERTMYRNMCKSVWQNLGKSTTYKTAV